MPYSSVLVPFVALLAVFLGTLAAAWGKSGGDIFVLLAVAVFALAQLLWVLVSAVIKKQKPWGVIGILAGLATCFF